MPAYYGRARRDYEPDVVYVEPRRSYDDDRRAPRESERERELQDELRRTRRALLEMRQTEGSALEKDLRGNADRAVKIVARIEKRMPKVVREHHKMLKKRVSELMKGSGHKVSENDLVREVALLAERLDVAEEISRLSSHFEQLDVVLSKGGAVGRRLEQIESLEY